MINYYFKSEVENKLKTLDGFRAGSWINVVSPTDDELDELKGLVLDSGLLRDALDPYEVPRTEIQDGVVYIFTRVPLSTANSETASILIALHDDFLVTLSSESLDIFKSFLGGYLDLDTTKSHKLFLQIFGQINNFFNSAILKINKQVRTVGVNLKHRVDSKDIVRFVSLENILNDYLSALLPTSNLLDNLMSKDYVRFHDDEEDLIEDLLLSYKQLIELCRGSLKSIVNIRETHSVVMANNLNRTIKLLTALTIVLTVPTIISSFYGMNVNLPFSQSPDAFWWILGLTVVVVFGLIRIFFNKDWL